MARKPTYEELEQSGRELEKTLTEERKHAEAMLEETQSTRQLLRFAPYGVYLVELSGKILALNQRGAEHLGRTVEEAVGTFMREYFPPEVAEKRRHKIVEIVASGKPVHFEEEVKGRWYDHSFFPILNDQGRVTQMAVFGADITERKQGEQALRESEETLRSIFRAAPIGIGMVIDRVFKQANDRLCEMLGYSREELLGRSARMVYPTDEDDADDGIWKTFGEVGGKG
ncbi:MAG: PAS domain S-box protein, partial [Syntrophales bacterium LBB04]|nr:PAS domain S-box protein [Syntrophales bacterium LBB04]